jgi:hypothetical protein
VVFFLRFARWIPAFAGMTLAGHATSIAACSIPPPCGEGRHRRRRCRGGGRHPLSLRSASSEAESLPGAMVRGPAVILRCERSEPRRTDGHLTMTAYRPPHQEEVCRLRTARVLRR